MAKTAGATKRSGVKRGAAAIPATRLDLAKELGDEYAPGREPRFVEVTPAHYLCVEGRGAPVGEAWGTAVGAIFATAWTVKGLCKKAGRDFKVMPLEGLWWGKAENTDFTSEPRETWNWKLLIRLPDFAGERELAGAREALAARGRAAGAPMVKRERIAEGRCVQALHVGPFSEERPLIERMCALAAESGLAFRGLHHEIYLSDFRRTAPARLRTIVRHPVEPVR